MEKIELLAPAGDFNKLKTAFYFGADAVYCGGKSFGLRAQAGNFSDEELINATLYAHERGKKIYVTVNVLARNGDIDELGEYLKFLEKTGIDGAIISDAGVISLSKEVAPALKINLSTQASALNYKAVEFWKNQGVKRVILARELSLKEIKEIREKVSGIEIETFIHGAMCISYSGRCLLSDYRTGRSSNRGECVQACRWNYEIRERGSSGAFMTVEEDGRGTYILNSKDLNLIDYIGELADAGVCSFKIEGRMKSEYYIATVVNAYRRAIDAYYRAGEKYKEDRTFYTETEKTAHREFTTAYLLGENDRTENFDDSQSKGTHKFIAVVTESGAGYAVAEMRNRFKTGDVLEVLSPTESFNKELTVGKMETMNGETIEDVKNVQQKVKIFTEIPLRAGDILRIKA
ncbi:MAG: U32 family peptidase [Clostridia bacterium]|nr:U32 family peptidase [Clostridia bacterium]